MTFHIELDGFKKTYNGFIYEIESAGHLEYDLSVECEIDGKRQYLRADKILFESESNENRD